MSDAEALEKAAASVAWEDAEAAYRLYVQENGYPRDGRSTWCLAWTGALSAARSSSPEAERETAIKAAEGALRGDGWDCSGNAEDVVDAVLTVLAAARSSEAVPAHSDERQSRAESAFAARWFICANGHRFDLTAGEDTDNARCAVCGTVTIGEDPEPPSEPSTEQIEAGAEALNNLEVLGDLTLDDRRRQARAVLTAALAAARPESGKTRQDER